MRIWVVFLVSALLLGSSTPFALAGESLPAAKKVMFQTTDKVKLYADVYVSRFPGSKSVAILLPMLGHDRHIYDPLIKPLLAKAISVVALDSRGQGESTARSDGSRIDYRSFKETDWANLPADTQGVINNLNKVTGLSTSNLALVGASIGANTAAIAGANDKRVKAVVLLSPGLNYRGLITPKAMRAFLRPSLIVAGKDDPSSAKDSRDLALVAGVQAKLLVYDKAGHGTQMFSSHPELITEIATWLGKQLK